MAKHPEVGTLEYKCDVAAGALQLLLEAVHRDDPKREILVRIGDLMRDVEVVTKGVRRSSERTSAPPGYILVPLEPTDEMLAAAVPFPSALVHERDDPTYTKRMELATTMDRAALRQKYIDMLAAVGEPGVSHSNTGERPKV